MLLKNQSPLWITKYTETSANSKITQFPAKTWAENSWTLGDHMEEARIFSYWKPCSGEWKEMSPMVVPTLLYPCAVDGQGRKRLDRKIHDLVEPQRMVYKYNGMGHSWTSVMFCGNWKTDRHLELQTHMGIPLARWIGSLITVPQAHQWACYALWPPWAQDLWWDAPSALLPFHACPTLKGGGNGGTSPTALFTFLLGWRYSTSKQSSLQTPTAKGLVPCEPCLWP